MDSHQTFPGTERTPAAVVAELQYGPTMVSGPYRKRNGLRITFPALRISAGCDRRQQVPVGLAGVEQ